MSITLVASCRKHPRYEAKLPPRCDCKDCRALYELAREFSATARTPSNGNEFLSRGPRSFCCGVVIPAGLVGTRQMEER